MRSGFVLTREKPVTGTGGHLRNRFLRFLLWFPGKAIPTPGDQGCLLQKEGRHHHRCGHPLVIVKQGQNYQQTGYAENNAQQWGEEDTRANHGGCYAIQPCN